MSDRELLDKCNSLLAAGLPLEQVLQFAKPALLSAHFSGSFRYLLAVCLLSGGSPASALRELELLAEQQAENQSKIRISGTVPKATARLMLWMPLGAAGLGQLVGLGSIEVFFRSLPALVSLLAGFMLLLAAHSWSARIFSGVAELPLESEVVLDAIALCLDCGLAPRQSCEVSLSEFKKCFDFEISNSVAQQITELLEFSEITGAQISQLFRNRSRENRRRQAHIRGEALENLSIRLLTPLATLVLPAFVLIAVLPISIALLTNN